MRDGSGSLPSAGRWHRASEDATSGSDRSRSGDPARQGNYSGQPDGAAFERRHAHQPSPYPSSFAHFNRKLLLTTLTLLRAIAAPAIMGSSRKPLMGYSAPAAMGMPMML